MISAVPVIGVSAYRKAPGEPALLVPYSLEQNPPFDRADLRAKVVIANDGNFIVLQETATNLALVNFYDIVGITCRPNGLAWLAQAVAGGASLEQVGDIKNGLGKLSPEAFVATLYQQVLGKGAGTPGLAEGIAHLASVYGTYGAGSALSIFAGALGEVEAAKLLTPGFQAIGQGVSYTVIDA